jgi:hypothetical protein
VGPTRGTYDHPLQVAFARGAWPSPHLLPHGGGVRPMATLLPALGSSMGPPPFSVCRRRRSSTAPLLSLHCGRRPPSSSPSSSLRQEGTRGANRWTRIWCLCFRKAPRTVASHPEPGAQNASGCRGQVAGPAA